MTRMLYIYDTEPQKIRSFIITLYDQQQVVCSTFAVPVTMIAALGNRIFRELLPDYERTVHEPWYKLNLHNKPADTWSRSPLPEGPTSLHSQRYWPESAPPPRLRLHPEASLRYCTMRLVDLQAELFCGEYSVDDVFLAMAERLARREQDKGQLAADTVPSYYSVLPSTVDVDTIPRDFLPPEAYTVEGVFRLPQLTPERERITFRKVEPPPWPERDVTAYGATRPHGRGPQAEGKVVMHASVYQALRHNLELSQSVEEGGCLLGQPYRQPGSPESESDPEFRWLLEITDIILAERTRSTPVSLLFTGETWSRITRRIDQDYPQKKLVSWFHTHLFQATDEFGLSGMDEDLHRRFFTRPWQVAVLVNIDRAGEREVRCFQRTLSGDLVECAFEVCDTPGEEPAL